MKIIITKEQYETLVYSYLDKYFPNLKVSEKKKGSPFRDVTSNGDDIGLLYHKSPKTKGCKLELALNFGLVEDYQKLIPVIRKKVFSETILKYFKLKTGIYVDCLEFNYGSGKFETFDDNGIEVEYERKKTYNYKKRK